MTFGCGEEVSPINGFQFPAFGFEIFQFQLAVHNHRQVPQSVRWWLAVLRIWAYKAVCGIWRPIAADGVPKPQECCIWLVFSVCWTFRIVSAAVRNPEPFTGHLAWFLKYPALEMSSPSCPVSSAVDHLPTEAPVFLWFWITWTPLSFVTLCQSVRYHMGSCESARTPFGLTVLGSEQAAQMPEMPSVSPRIRCLHVAVPRVLAWGPSKCHAPHRAFRAGHTNNHFILYELSTSDKSGHTSKGSYREIINFYLKYQVFY